MNNTTTEELCNAAQRVAARFPIRSGHHMVESLLVTFDCDVDKVVAELEGIAERDPVWAARCAKDAA